MHGVLAIGGKHAVETGFFGFAGQGDLFAFDDVARPAF